MSTQKIITFTNQKGGVGKSTSVVNIAASLGVRGKKVLVVDVDPQGNTTSGFGINKKKLNSTVYDVFTGHTAVEDALIPTEFRGISILPANIDLAGAEFELVTADTPQTRLRTALSVVRGLFDYILIDCPPSLGLLTINALVAADWIVIPMQCEYYSLEGLSQLMASVKQIKKKFNPTLSLLGILITMYNGRLNLSVQVLDELKKYYPDKLFTTPIARNVTLSEAPSFGQPVWYYDRSSKGSQQYDAVAAELLARTEAKEE